MRNKALVVLLTSSLLMQPASAERRLQRDQESLRGTTASQIKLRERAIAKSAKPIQLIVQYSAPSTRGIAKSAAATSLAEAVKKLGGKQEALFETKPTAVGARGAAPASDQATLSSDVQSRLRAVNERFPQRAKRGVVTDVPPGNSFLTAQVVELPAGTNLQGAIATLTKVTGVTSVYEAREYKINQTPQRQSSLDEVYGIQAIQAPQVWQSATQGEGITVAINDTGIYFNHKALAPNLWKNSREIAGNCIDDDSNGFVDDVYGISSVDSPPQTFKYCTNPTSSTPSFQGYVYHPMDCHGHGSHVAGTVAAVDDGSFGLSGVAPHAKIMALKGLTDGGGGTTVGLARNIVYATDNGADIINNSWGAGPISLPDPVLTDAIRYAAAAGVVNVFAAGNDGMDMALSDPANMEEVIAVGAIDSENKLADFSNFGARIDVVAPGVAVNSSIPDTCSVTEKDPLFGDVPVSSSDFTTLSGTSMAAPHVSGAVALLLSANPALRVDEVRAILRASADDLGAPGFDSQFGSGRVNVSRAVSMATAGKPIPKLTIRSANPSLYRDNVGRYPLLQITGAAISGKGSRISIRDYNGKNGSLVASNTRDVRNGTIASVNVSNRPDGRYILEVSSQTDLGTFHSTTMLELLPTAKILDTAPGSLNWEEEEYFQRPTFKGTGAGWKVSEEEPNKPLDEGNHVYRIVDRNQKQSSTPRVFKIAKYYKREPVDSTSSPQSYAVSPLRFSMLSYSPWSAQWFAFDYHAQPFTGSGADIGVGIVPFGKDLLTPTVVGREMPSIYSLQPVQGGPGDRHLTVSRDIGFATIENKIQVLRSKSPSIMDATELSVEELLKSDKGTFLENGSLVFPPNKRGGDPVFTAREWRPISGSKWGSSIVLYPINWTAPPTKKVLVSEPGRIVEEHASDYDMSCFVSSSNAVRDEWYLGLVEHSTGVKFKVASGRELGGCRIPQEKFLTYLSWDRDGVYLNGYDVRTGKSGRTILSDYIFFYSFTATGDGNLAWIENYQSGTRLVELDVTAFRASINKPTGRGTPAPTVAPVY